MSLTAEPSENSIARTISVSEFRANCPALLDTVRDTGQEIIVTKHGQPVAAVGPVRASPPDTLAGMATDIIHLPPDFDIDEVELFDPDWLEQWSAKWDERLTGDEDQQNP